MHDAHVQSKQQEAAVLAEIGDGGFCAADFEIVQQLGRLSWVCRHFQPTHALRMRDGASSHCICLNFIEMQQGQSPVPIMQLLQRYNHKHELFHTQDCCNIVKPCFMYGRSMDVSSMFPAFLCTSARAWHPACSVHGHTHLPACTIQVTETAKDDPLQLARNLEEKTAIIAFIAQYYSGRPFQVNA
jgi:hypothetical protein